MESNGLINVYTRDKLWLCAIMSRIFCFMKRKFLPNIYIHTHTRTIEEYELNKVTVAAKFIIIVTYWIDTELISHVTAAELCIPFCCNLIHWLLESQMLAKWCNLFILFRSNRFFPFSNHNSTFFRFIHSHWLKEKLSLCDSIWTFEVRINY